MTMHGATQSMVLSNGSLDFPIGDVMKVMMLGLQMVLLGILIKGLMPMVYRNWATTCKQVLEDLC